jgi:hypothetical protein
MANTLKVLTLFIALTAGDNVCPGYNFAVQKTYEPFKNINQYDVLDRARGLITSKQFEAIEAKNTMLDRQAMERKLALERKWDVETVNKKHKRETSLAESRGAAVGLKSPN